MILDRTSIHQYLTGFPSELYADIQRLAEREIQILQESGLEKETAEEVVGSILESMRPLCEGVTKVYYRSCSRLFTVYHDLKAINSGELSVSENE